MLTLVSDFEPILTSLFKLMNPNTPSKLLTKANQPSMLFAKEIKLNQEDQSHIISARTSRLSQMNNKFKKRSLSHATAENQYCILSI